MTFTLYHGHASPADLEQCKAAAPSIDHGVMWSDPKRMPERDGLHAADNGAYSGFTPSKFIDMLDKLSTRSKDPEFVVLPDRLNDWEKTQERARGWNDAVDKYGFDRYVVGQPPAEPESVVELADELGVSGVFLGGDDRDWKFATAVEIDDYPVHIGSPGLGQQLLRAADVADSADTSSIVVNDAFHHLVRLEQQSRFRMGEWGV